MPPSPSRPRFEGVVKIARYNWPIYVGGMLAALFAPVVLTSSATRRVALPAILRGAVWAGSALAGWWTFASLGVSYWVYDASPLKDGSWLQTLGLGSPRNIANIHAGVDEIGPALIRAFPDANLATLDIFDETEMDEPSIRRARQMAQGATPAHPSLMAQPARFDALPLDAASQDALFCVFAAHELRRAAARQHFFAELDRVLLPGGYCVLLEHVRDAANFGAFGPGFLHFLPGAEWERLGRERFKCERAERITPFVRLWVWRKA